MPEKTQTRPLKGARADVDAAGSATVYLVDYLWRLKKKIEKPLLIRIPTNLLIKDSQYRNEILIKAATLDDPEVQALVKQIRRLEIESDYDQQTHPIGNHHQADSSKTKWLYAIICTALIAMGMFMLYSPNTDYEPANHNTALKSDLDLPADDAATMKAAIDKPVSAETIMRLHGSNTVGEKLAPALLNAFFDNKAESSLAWKTGEVEVEKSALFKLDQKNVKLTLAAHGSATAFTALENNITDIGMSSRKIKVAEQQKLMLENGDLSQPGSEHIIGLDGLAIIVHPNNPLKQLTLNQLANIFSGKVQRWQDMNIPFDEINLYARDDKSGTWDTFNALVLKPNNRSLLGSAQRFESSSLLSEAVANDVNGIGFIGIPYIDPAKAIAISESINHLAIYPTTFSVATEDYPLSRRLYLYTSAKENKPLLREFISFVLSYQGQQVVEQVGLVSLNIRLEQPRLNAEAPAVYSDIAKTAKRLSLNFSFRSGSFELDSKAARDLDRIVDFSSKIPDKDLILFGFADNTGNASMNRRLSLARAQIVEKELMRRGIFAREVHGLGEVLPIASNLTEAGRNKNRRVEIWQQ